MNSALFCLPPPKSLPGLRPRLADSATPPPRSGPQWQCALLGRREVLQLVVAAVVARAAPAEALNKKRILAKAGPEVTMDNGIKYRDITVGRGYSPRAGDTVAVHYSLFYKDLEIESSRESQGLAALPLGFTFGSETGPGSVIKVIFPCGLIPFELQRRILFRDAVGTNWKLVCLFSFFLLARCLPLRGGIVHGGLLRFALLTKFVCRA
jgi:hypothetical protein